MDKKELAVRLFKTGAIQFGEFRLKMHEYLNIPLSPIYINLRCLPEGNLTDEIIREIGQALWENIRKSGFLFQLVAGIPKAGDPLAKALVKSSGNAVGYDQLIFLRKEETLTGRRILPEIGGEAMLKPKDVCLLVDDLITGADSKIEAIEALRKNDLLVSDCLVLVDREQGGKEELARRGVKLHSVFTMSELLDIYVKEGLISEEVKQEVIGYREIVEKYIEKHLSE